MNKSKVKQSLYLAENYFRSGTYQFSEKILKSIIRIDPTNSKANELLAYIYGNQGNSDKSYQLLKQACEKNDCSPDAFYYLGSAQLKRKLYEEASLSFKKSMQKAGPFFEALHDLGSAYGHMEKIQESLSCYQDCLKFNPNSHELRFNIGKCFFDLWCHNDALTYYTEAIQLKPDFIEAWTSKGITLNELKRYDEAIVHFDKAISFKSDCVEAWANKGLTLNELKRYDEAIVHFDKAISLKADIDWIPGALLAAKMSICHWADLDDSLKKISARVIANEKVTPPFTLIALTDNALLHKQSAQIFIQDKYPLNTALGPIPKHVKKEKIRIGYFSADFRNHPVSFLTSELFEIHNRDRFEVLAFSLQKAPVGDEMNLRLRKCFDRFIDIDNMSDSKIAELVRELGIDIAIDLSGLTADSRTGIFSYRAAPIQVNWLGYAGTIGSDYIDYIVADKTIIPESYQQFYNEKVAYLPHTYIVDDSKRVVSSRIFTREEFGLPQHSFVFFCFNKNYKINPQVLDGWSRILLKMGHSVLWLEQNDHFKSNLINEFESRGIDSMRIIFAKRVELMSDHLSRYALADLFLDTHPYNAHTTAVDSLKAGVPVLTLIGQSFASRVASSLLNAIGLRELITNTQEEYEALAIELAMNPKKLADIKLKLANNRFTEPLFNTPLFAKNLEAAYIKMYEQYQADFLPENIFIT